MKNFTIGVLAAIIFVLMFLNVREYRKYQALDKIYKATLNACEDIWLNCPVKKDFPNLPK